MMMNKIYLFLHRIFNDIRIINIQTDPICHYVSYQNMLPTIICYQDFDKHFKCLKCICSSFYKLIVDNEINTGYFSSKLCMINLMWRQILAAAFNRFFCCLHTKIIHSVSYQSFYRLHKGNIFSCQVVS